MTALAQALVRIVGALETLRQPYALVGGLAVSSRAEPRMTRDADVVVAVPDDATAERLVSELAHHGYVAETLVEQVATGRLATVRLRSADSPGILTDLLFASSGVEVEVVQGAELLEVLPGVMLPVASTGALIALKLLARDDRHRPNDADDLNRLAEVATDRDWLEASELVELIEQRGYHRDRDLVASLSTLRRDGAF
jgi:predicted nucleotidyltransferase